MKKGPGAFSGKVYWCYHLHTLDRLSGLIYAGFVSPNVARVESTMSDIPAAQESLAWDRLGASPHKLSGPEGGGSGTGLSTLVFSLILTYMFADR